MNTIQRTIAVLASLATMMVLILPPNKFGYREVVTDWVGVIIWIMAIAGIAGLLMFVFKEK